MLGDSVLCWCLFSGWRQCWVTLYCVGVCFTIYRMLGDSVLCWCLFSGWRQCWVTLYCVGVCFQGGGSAG